MQHRLLVANVNKRKLNEVIKRESKLKRVASNLKEGNLLEKFEKRVEELVDVGTTNLW